MLARRASEGGYGRNWFGTGGTTGAGTGGGGLGTGPTTSGGSGEALNLGVELTYATGDFSDSTMESFTRNDLDDPNTGTISSNFNDTVVGGGGGLGMTPPVAGLEMRLRSSAVALRVAMPRLN